MLGSIHPRRIALAIALSMTVACGGRAIDDPDGNTGGTAGAGGDGGAGGTGGGGAGGAGGITAGDSGVCGCTTLHIGWGMEGGFTAWQESSALEVCNLFVHRRVPRAPDPPGISCQQPMTDCAGKFGPEDVTRAIAHPEVKTALAAAPVLYGEDPRPVDGAVMRMQIGAAIVDVGTECRSAGCKPIPAGVSSLAELLRAITKQELSRAPCSTIFAPPP